MNKREIPDLFARDVNDLIIPEALESEVFSIVRRWRVIEYINGTTLQITIRNLDSLKINFNYEGDKLPPDAKYMIEETINEDYLKENLDGDKNFTIKIYGNIIGGSVSSDFKTLDRHYYVVDDISINTDWLSYGDIKDFCDDFELECAPDFGIFSFDFKKFLTRYQNLGLDNFFEFLSKSLMEKVSDYDKQEGIETISKFGEEKDSYFPCYGVKGRTQPQMYDKNKNRIQFKLLTKDLNKLHSDKKS